MAYRYSCKNAAVAVAGTTFAHGLGATPDEWFFNHRTAPPGGTNASLYLTAAPGTTSMIVASASGATTADVFCAINHTVIA